VRLLSVQISPK